MLIYEVTTRVGVDIAADYERYMTEQHIPDVLATGYFAAAFFAKNDDTYRIGYHADSQELFEAYVANDAERLRADFAEHFPTGIDVSRQVFDIVGLFPAP